MSTKSITAMSNKQHPKGLHKLSNQYSTTVVDKFHSSNSTKQTELSTLSKYLTNRHTYTI